MHALLPLITHPSYHPNPAATGSRMLHLSYHDGEHYNSVRRGDDYSRGSPADIPEHLAPVADVAQVC